MDFDVESMSAEEFAALEDWQLRQLLQYYAGKMAVAQAIQRANAEAHNKYMEGKAEFSRYRQLSSLLQTVLRTAV